MSGRFYLEEGRWVPRRRRRRGSGLRILLFLLVSALGGAAGYYYALHSRPLGAGHPGEIQASSLLSPIESSSQASLLARLASAFPGRRFVTLLLLGTDEDKVRGRTDSMILMLIDLHKKRLGAVTIPRDTRVPLPGHGDQKVNAAYVFGGVDLARQVIGELLGCRIDHYLKTNIAGFVKLVDLLGGVELEVERRMRYRDRAQGLFIRLDPGRQWLDGDRAMQYVRFRHDRMGDLGRVRRQQKFLRALAEQALRAENLARLPAVLDHLPDAVETDLNLYQMKALLAVFRGIDFSEAPAVQLPGRVEMKGAYYLVVEPAAARRTLENLLISLAQEPGDVSLTVTSAPEHADLCPEARRRLQAAGFRLVETGERFDPPPAGATTILDSQHHYFLRKRIERVLGIAGTEEEANGLPAPTGVDLAVIIGPDVPWALQDDEEA